MIRVYPDTMKKRKPQITQITQIFLVFLSCLSCVSWIIFIAVPHDAAPSPGNEWKPTQMICAAYRSPMPWGPWPPEAKKGGAASCITKN